MMKKAFDMSFAPFEGALIAGVDEAGRGPLAGPVVTAAVILPRETPELVGLDDSKAISKAERERLAEKIKSVAIAYSAHIQSAHTIDEHEYLCRNKGFDGTGGKGTCQSNPILSLRMPCHSLQIVLQNRLLKAMQRVWLLRPHRLLQKRREMQLWMIYITNFLFIISRKMRDTELSEHVLALQTHGPCKHHRTSFEPVKSMLKGRRKNE